MHGSILSRFIQVTQPTPYTIFVIYVSQCYVKDTYWSEEQAIKRAEVTLKNRRPKSKANAASTIPSETLYGARNTIPSSQPTNISTSRMRFAPSCKYERITHVFLSLPNRPCHAIILFCIIFLIFLCFCYQWKHQIILCKARGYSRGGISRWEIKILL